MLETGASDAARTASALPKKANCPAPAVISQHGEKSCCCCSDTVVAAADAVVAAEAIDNVAGAAEAIDAAAGAVANGAVAENAAVQLDGIAAILMYDSDE
jgi:hypothetical protein